MFENRSSAADVERAARSIRRIGESAASADAAFQIAIASGKLPARSNKDSSSANFCEPTDTAAFDPEQGCPSQVDNVEGPVAEQILVHLPNHFATDKAYPARAQIFSQIDLGNSRRLPELHRVVTRTRGQGLSIRTPGHAPNRVSVPLQGGQQFACGGLPELHRVVIRTRGQGLSIRTPGNAINPAQCAPARCSAVCPWQPPRASPCGHENPRPGSFRPDSRPRCKPRRYAPARSSAVCPWRPPRASPSGHENPRPGSFHPDSRLRSKPSSVCPCKVVSSLPVAASQSFTVWSVRTRGQSLSIRTPGNAANRVGVPLQGAQQLARGGLPELHRLVTRTRGQGLSIRTPGNAKNALVCPCKVASSLPVAVSQSFTVWSSEPEARVFPSGLQATL